MTKFLTLSSIMNNRDGTRTYLITFARFDNGMVIGAVQDTLGRFGEDAASAVSRAFIDHESAIAWVKVQCRILAGREDVDFVEHIVKGMLQ